MMPLIQVSTILVMTVITYFVYRTLGPPSDNFLYTFADKASWDRLVQRPIGRWFARTNIFASITSLATVYIFFLGNSRLFGIVTFITVVTIFAGGFVTNHFTDVLTKRYPYKDLYEGDSPSASVITAIFWNPSATGKHAAEIAKWASLIHIIAVLWLEFSVFADLSGQLLADHNIVITSVLLWIVSFTVFIFTLRYGLRGIAFADIFHAPVIVVSTIVLLAGSVALLIVAPKYNLQSVSFGKAITPILPWPVCAAFAVATIALNGFLVLVTEPHWLRLWAFRGEESNSQFPALAITVGSWGTLIVIGLIINAIAGTAFTPATDAVDVVAYWLKDLIELSPVFLMAFWAAGMGTLFSVTDLQIYSFFLIRQFNTETGSLDIQRLHGISPLWMAGTLALLFVLLYVLVRITHVPFEKLVFLLLPSCMVLTPAFVRAYRGREQSIGLLWSSIGAYVVCSIAALFPGDWSFYFTVAAPFVPVVIAAGAIKGGNPIEIPLLDDKAKS